MIMNAKILCLAAITFTTPALAQSASEYLSMGCCRFRGHQLKLIGPDFQNLQG